MEDGLKIVLWAALIIGSIVSSVIKAAKKNDEKIASRAKEAEYEEDMALGESTKSFRQAIENLAREAAKEKPMREAWPAFGPAEEGSWADSGDSRPVSAGSGGGSMSGFGDSRSVLAGSGGGSRPVLQPAYAQVLEPAATSYDYRSLEETDDEMTVYERVTAAREGRANSAAAKISAASKASSAAAASSSKIAAVSAAAAPVAAMNGTDGTAHLDFDFDLRRAVIEAEILTPKWL